MAFEYRGVKKKIRRIIGKSVVVLSATTKYAVIKDTKCLDRIYYLYRILVMVFPFIPKELYFDGVAGIINDIVSEEKDSKEKIKVLWKQYYRISDDNRKMMMSDLLYCCNLFDDDIVEMLVQSIHDLNNERYRYYATMDISSKGFVKNNDYYPNYFIDRRALLKRIAIDSNLVVPERKNQCQKSKVCVVVYRLSPSIKNSMLRVASMFANSLITHYEDVMVISLESLYKSKLERRSLAGLVAVPSSRDSSNEISRYFDDKIEINYALGRNYQERMQSALNTIYDYNPDFIIDISDEYSPIGYYYSHDFPTFYMPMRGIGTSQFFDYIIAPKQILLDNISLFGSIDEDSVIDWTFPEYVPLDEKAFVRSDYGIAEDAFVILSIGNNSAFEDKFVDSICKMIETNSEFIWVLVGSKSPDSMRQKYKSLYEQQRIIDWGYENHLVGLCKIGNIILRANVSGGSGGTAFGAMQGLPIVMTNYICDANRWLGKDYSKLTEYEDLVSEIEKLYNDKNYYNMRSNDTKDLVNKIMDSEKQWEYLFLKIDSELE